MNQLENRLDSSPGGRSPEDYRFQLEFKRDVEKIVLDILQGRGFTERKITDTPNDNLQVVNRKYVTLNGVSSLRPNSPVIGQFYFDTDLGYPIWYNGANWVKYDGTTV